MLIKVFRFKNVDDYESVVNNFTKSVNVKDIKIREIDSTTFEVIVIYNLGDNVRLL